MRRRRDRLDVGEKPLPLLWCLICLCSLVCLMPAFAFAEPFRHFEITVAVVDEADKPVAYVAVWRLVDPCQDPRTVPATRLCATPQSFHRLASRLRETSEYALSLSTGRPLEQIDPIGVLDTSAILINTSKEHDFRNFLGTGLVKEMTISYVFLKQGYEPTLFTTVVNAQNTRVNARVVMKRDTLFPRREAVYRQTYERIRYELTDEEAGLAGTPENIARLNRIEAELQQAADQAEAAGDNRTAAVIYFQMLCMPHVVLAADGSISEYKRTGGRPNTKLYHRKSIALDPESPYRVPTLIEERISGTLYWTPVKDMTPEILKTLKRVADEREVWMVQNRDRVWPRDEGRHGVFLGGIGLWERAYKWLKEVEQRVPEYEGMAAILEGLGIQMYVAKVPVPADWVLEPTLSKPKQRQTR